MTKFELERPKYKIMGKLEPMDEADTVLVQGRLIPDSEEWEKYYEMHPDYEKLARKLYDAQGRYILEKSIQDELMDPAMRFVTQDILNRDDYVDGVPADKKTIIDPVQASKKIQGFAMLMGADLVKIGPLNPAWIYTHQVKHDEDGRIIKNPVILKHPHAIVVAMPYRLSDIECAPRSIVGLATIPLYMHLSVIVIALAKYIRSLGYQARAHNINSQIMQVPVAIDAGLGELSRNGIIITREYGSAVKPFIVTTDLPVVYDKPVDIGVDEYCSQCDICSRICPVGAIPRGSKKVVRGVLKWAINGLLCFDYFKSTGSNCSLCIAYCPWTRSRQFPHNLVAKGVKYSNLIRKIAVSIDKMLLREKTRDNPIWMDKQPEIWKKFLKPHHPFYSE